MRPVEAKHQRVVVIVNPRGQSLGGNRVTGPRWAALLRRLGWRVRHCAAWDGRPADLLVALHAFHSARDVESFNQSHPGRPIVVAATGTDIHGAVARRATVEATLERATRIVLLQSASLRHLAPSVQARARVIHQSVCLPRLERTRRFDRFDAVVVANVRAVKDPLLSARAARLVDARSALHVTLVGALEADFDRRALDLELRENPRFTWAGPLTHHDTLQAILDARVLVSTSLHEGGPAVVSEALALSVPVLATHIPAHVGMLGVDYPGLFECGDATNLARLLERAEQDPTFLDELVLAGAPAAQRTLPEYEVAAFEELLADVGFGRPRARD